MRTLHNEDETLSDGHDDEIVTSERQLLVTANIHLPPKNETRNTKQKTYL